MLAVARLTPFTVSLGRSRACWRRLPARPLITFRAMEGELPHIPDVERLAPRVIRVLGGNPGKFTLQGTNTYLVGSGPSRTLIDTAQGEPGWVANITRALQEENASIGTVLLTHWHPDHIGGMPDVYKTVAPAAQVFKMRPTYLGYGEVAKRIHGLSAQGLLRESEWADIADGQSFAVEPGCALRALHCPGHTEDHMAFVLEEEDNAAGSAPRFAGMFTGDNVLGMGTTVFEDLAAYMASLARMRDAFPAGVAPAFPAHGPAIADGRAKVAEYIAHRAAREAQVLRVLGGRGGAELWSSMDIVKVIYKDVPESLHAPAERGVAMVLAKLERDGRVEQDDYSDRWRCK